MRTFAIASSLTLLAGLGALPLSADDPAPAPVPAAPAPNTDELQAKVLKWIADLGSEDFRTREAAFKDLAGVGASARDALEAAAKTSDSLEVRWRAQQLLLKLGGKEERPLDAPGAPEPDAGGRTREFLDAETPDAFRRLWEKTLRDFQRRGLQPFGPGSLDRMNETFAGFGNVLRAGDLTLVLPIFGDGEHRLIVRGKGGLADAATHTGASLEDILAANPNLKDAVGLDELKQQLAERKKRGGLMQGFSFGGLPGGTMTFRMATDGVEMRQDANGAVVKIQERDADGRPVLGEDGKPVVEEYRGATLEEIKTKHPELAKRLDSLGQFRLDFGAPRVFRGPHEQGLAPMPPVAPETPLPQPGAVRFGLKLAPMEPVLALHLGLAEGHGVIVTHVEQGSQAALVGLRRYDVIESIDGQPVLGFNAAVAALRAKAQDATSALNLGIVRTGQRQALSR
jgi:hypothetical protein